jgi:TonB family protein
MTDSRAGMPTGPIRRPARWVGGGPTDADNPQGRYQGSLAVQVTVGPGGRVSHCVPVRGSGSAGLDAMTCRLVRDRAQFEPALDAQGRPVASQAYATFVWGRRPRP